MPSRSYKTSDYLTTPQERAAYLNAVLKENDVHLFITALKNIVLSWFNAAYIFLRKRNL